MSVIAQMKLLINLAQIDGLFADREKKYIVNIGRANGIYPDEIISLFDKNHALIIPKNLSEDDRFNYIFSLVQLMKIDERMYKEEMLFCSKIAENLGYNKEVMFDLLLHIRTTVMNDEEIEVLKKHTQKHLKN